MQMEEWNESNFDFLKLFDVECLTRDHVHLTVQLTYNLVCKSV